MNPGTRSGPPLRALLGVLLTTGCALVEGDDVAFYLDPDEDGLDWEHDCDSTNPDIGGPETVLLYPDQDSDGYGDREDPRPWEHASCPEASDLEGMVLYGKDCDDQDPSVSPSADERCDTVDNDCDDEVDESACSVSGATAVTASTLQVRGPDAGTSAGWAVLGDLYLDGDDEPDAAIASLGASTATGGMLHVLLGPLVGDDGFSPNSVGVLYADDAIGGSTTRSPDVRVLAAIRSGGADTLIGGGPQSEAESGVGDAWVFDVGDDPALATWTSLRDSLPDEGADLLAFGAAVAAHGGSDDAGGGAPFIAVGAPQTWTEGADDDLVAAGAVQLFTMVDGEPSAGALIEGAELGQFAGSAVATADLDGDGCGDLAVGAWPVGQVGTVELVQEACLLGQDVLTLDDISTATLRGLRSDDGVGSVVVGSDDLTGDGADDLLVGAPSASVDSETEAGRVWLIRGASTVASSFSEPSATWEWTESSAHLGASVSQAGDVDADGVPDLIMGAPGAGRVAPLAGAAWIVYGPLPMSGAHEDLGDSNLHALRADGVQNLGEVGRALAPAGLSSDGRGDAVLIGAPGADYGDASAGAAVGRVYYFTPN